LRILIAGYGMVGSNLGKCLRLAGHIVVFHEINKARQLTAHEEGFGASDYNYMIGPGVINYDAVFICVPTPTVNGKQDLSMVEAALKTIAGFKNIAHPKLLFVKSTVLPGTMRKTVYPHFRRRFFSEEPSGYVLVSNPEFLTESDPINTILRKPIILGFNKKQLAKLHELYEFIAKLYPSPLFSQEWFTTSWDEAELTKYASNFILASRISAWNQINVIARKLKVSSKNIAFVLSEQSTIGKYGIYHGKAYSGHCLPKDNKALHAFTRDLGVQTSMLLGTNEMNDYMKLRYGENNEKYVW